jgi:hypothetical protein
MSSRDLRDRIYQQHAVAQDKRVFLVEGIDDVAAYTLLLNRFYSNNWEQRWAIAPAGNKRQLRELLTLEPNWLGLVDRDEWDAAALHTYTTNQPNLVVLPRFCLESYLILPSELWQALPDKQQEKVQGGHAEFEQALIQQLPNYLRHGVLWGVVTPLWEGLRALGFKESLASFDSMETAQDDTQIQQVLQAWDELLDPNRLLADFKGRLATAQQMTIPEQLKLQVHGKLYWEKVVNPEMNRYFGQLSAKKRRLKVLEHLPELPEDLSLILDRLV